MLRPIGLALRARLRRQRNGTFLLRRSHPSLKTEGNDLASTAVIDFEIACLRQSPEIRCLCAPRPLISQPVGQFWSLINSQFSSDLSNSFLQRAEEGDHVGLLLCRETDAETHFIE